MLDKAEIRKELNIAVGTTRKPKVDGIKAGFEELGIYYSPLRSTPNFICVSAESGVSGMPLSIEEVMRGAKGRATDLIAQGIDADYYVGIEGGATRFGEKAYLFGTVYVQNKEGEGHFGFSPMLEVPSLVDTKIYEEGAELGPLMGELSGRTDIRSENGSMGAWSEDMFTRKDEFSVAFKAAMVPFFNRFYQL